MKQVFIILALILTATFTQAQDASNDATWEETIGFINKYKNDLNFKISIEGRERFCHIDSFTLNGNILTIYPKQDWYYYSNDDVMRIKYQRKLPKQIQLDLYNLSRYDNDGGIYFIKNLIFNIQARGKAYSFRTYGGGYKKNEDVPVWDKKYGIKSFEFVFWGNTELEPRMRKAFKHLAYLATQKREAERKASGDKF